MHARFLSILALGGSTFLAACVDGGKDDTGGTVAEADADTDADSDADTDADSDADTDADTDADAFIRVAHLANDVPAVEVYVNDGDPAAIPSLSFPEGTPYIALPAGPYNFDVALEGTGLDAAVLTADVTLEAGAYYTAVAVGSLAGADAQILALADDSTGLESGSLRIRVIHAAPAVPDVDVWVLNGEPTQILDDYDYLASDAVIDVPAGAYRLGFDINDDGTPDVVFDTPELPGDIYINLFAVNDADGNVFLNAQLPDGTFARIDPAVPGRVRVLHLGLSVPAVDIHVNGADPAAIAGLEYKQTTGYVDLYSGLYDFGVSLAGTGAAAAVLTVDDFQVNPGEWTSVAAIGELGDTTNPPQILAITEDLSPIDPGNVRVRLVHGAPNVGAVDIWDVTAGRAPVKLADNYVFGQADVSADIPTGNYTFGIDATEDGVPDLTFAVPSAALPGGARVNVYAINRTGGGAALLAQYEDGTTAEVLPPLSAR